MPGVLGAALALYATAITDLRYAVQNAGFLRLVGLAAEHPHVLLAC